jgi:hypothetical protein
MAAAAAYDFTPLDALPPAVACRRRGVTSLPAIVGSQHCAIHQPNAREAYVRMKQLTIELDTCRSFESDMKKQIPSAEPLDAGGDGLQVSQGVCQGATIGRSTPSLLL